MAVVSMQLGGPTWTVRLGRRDSLATYQGAANRELPAPFSDLSVLISMFHGKGLTPREMTALSGAHTIGQAQCSQFDDHIYNDRNINATFAALRRRTCPRGGSSALAPLDSEMPYRFDNGYYRELVARRVLLQSDQAQFIGRSQLARRGGEKVQRQRGGIRQGLRGGDGQDGSNSPASWDAGRGPRNFLYLPFGMLSL
ncbi:hypothetical protein ZIOFF_050038 [Zingiber officinale]|uniref:Plant heme peroxidase family profile domain-containing protein n=1 Tax=Zingiber officinale TaxID=94328 RepID=A0A8J5FG24_ZINOF|nr:hypothetical protein ZIOFF_050038 [Zingiber officinale]